MTRDGVRGAAGGLEAIERACDAGLDAQALLEEVATQIHRVVRTDAFFLAATDPETTLCMGAGVLREMPQTTCMPLWDHEFYVPDYNKFTDMAATGTVVADLHEATAGVPSRSSRWVALNALAGWDAELRTAFALDGVAWGIGALHRMSDGGRFSDGEIGWLRAVAPVVARGLRRAMLAGSATPPTRGPGVIVLDADGAIASLTPEAQAWLNEIDAWTPEIGPRAPLPFAVLAEEAAIAARGTADARPRGHRMRLRTRSGVWLLLHVSFLPDTEGEGGCHEGQTVLVIEPARASDVAPLIVEAYALTNREVEITRMIARGMRTAEIAQRLHLSAHTVRDHVKAIFEKTGVSSRGELVAKVFAEHYLDGVHDAMDAASQRLDIATMSSR